MTDVLVMEVFKSLQYLIDNDTCEYLEVSLVYSSKESSLAVRLFKATSKAFCCGKLFEMYKESQSGRERSGDRHTSLCIIYLGPWSLHV